MGEINATQPVDVIDSRSESYLSRNFRSLYFTRILFSFLLIPRSVLEDLYSANLQAGVNIRGTLSVPAVTATDKRNRYLFFTSR
jgi:hypothetical protein